MSVTRRLLDLAEQLGPDEQAVLLLVAERLTQQYGRADAWQGRRRDAVTILEAMHDPALFGPWFARRASWGAWEVFLL